MSINAVDLLEHVIVPTLNTLGLHSQEAELLLLGTADKASGFDPFCCNQNKFGIYQISTRQHRCVWDEYLAFRPDLASKVRGLASQHQFLKNPDQELTTNLAYSTAVAWMINLQREYEQMSAENTAA